MKSSIIFKISTLLLPLVLGAYVLSGCKKESNNSYEDYAPVDSLAATFTVTPLAGSDTKFVITNTTQGQVVGTRWDVGKGSGLVMGKTSDTVFYPLAGTYSVKMQALDKRGKLYNATPVSITTTKSDPAFDNLIRGGKFNAGDEQFWGKYDAQANRITWAITNNAYNATAPVKPVNGGIYQAVQVVANKKYTFKMKATYDPPQDAWLEIYFGQAVPADTKDYVDNKKLSYITWGTWTAFSGQKTVDVTFGASGTIYVVIKAGCNAPSGSFSNLGLNVTDVDFRRVQE